MIPIGQSDDGRLIIDIVKAQMRVLGVWKRTVTLRIDVAVNKGDLP